MLLAPAWDRELLASGLYKYARQVPAGADVEAALRAGTILYYREGATGTVSVKRLTGDLSLAIDGKVDASTAGDMITQKVLAHLPLLMHPSPRSVGIIGLGSGVTLGSALTHPVSAVDVIEISPEVVEASRYFEAENRHALDDPRTRLIVGDGRSHLALSSRQYDVIVSEPSNPWMAGVAALFTREFFTILRSRLSPGGLICQWAHTYDISPEDLRSIVATFVSVFPDGTMWLVGNGDLLMVGTAGPLGSALERIESSWQRPGVAADLQSVAISAPFSLWSLFAGGGDELRAYAGDAAVQFGRSHGARILRPPRAERGQRRQPVIAATAAATIAQTRCDCTGPEPRRFGRVARPRSDDAEGGRVRGGVRGLRPRADA